MKINYKKGNALIIVILILAVIFIGALFLSTYTSGQARNIEKALGGDQTASLADAAINRAMHILNKELTDPKTFDPSSPIDSPAIALCFPMPAKKGKDNVLNDEIGNDNALDLSVLEAAGIKNSFTYTKDQLIKDDKEKILENFVNYAGFEKVEDWDVNVTVEIESAYRITAKDENGEEYSVPGVDIPYSISKTVNQFMENKGAPSVEFYFPEQIKLMDFTVPINIHIPVLNADIQIANINIGGIIDAIVRPMTKGTGLAKLMQCDEGVGITDLVTVHKLLNALVEKLEWKEIYPFTLSVYKEKFFETKDTLWPAGVNLPDAMDRYIEKYGTMNVISEAEIKFANGTTSKRRIVGTRNFKVSDIMPMAPMHSFFIANTANNPINFNNRGGQLYVNNNAGKVIPLSKRQDLGDHAGQIRVNYKPNAAAGSDNDSPLVINVSLLGDTDGPKLTDKTGLWGNIVDGTLNMVGGMDELLMLGSIANTSVTNVKYTADWTINSDVVKKKDPETKKKVPVGVKLKSGKLNHGFQLSSKYTERISVKPQYIQNRDKYNNTLKKHHDQGRLWNQPEFRFGKDGGIDDKIEAADKWKKSKKILNFIPDMDKFSSNIIGFGAAMVQQIIAQTQFGKLPVTFGSEAKSNKFTQFELPQMGTANALYCFPTLGIGQNKTHLFGTSALYPTLTRDIEGAVAKRYRQWRLTIIGLFARDRLPILPFPPYNVPPIPIPYWWADDKIMKYDYNLFFLKPYDSDTRKADGSYSWYDPDEAENMPANWYSNEQYAKKSNYFYKDWKEFLKDIPNRTCEVKTDDGQTVNALQLNGVTFISGSLGSDAEHFKPEGSDTLYVTGKGIIACSGNAILDCNIKYANMYDGTVFSLILRNGGLVFDLDKKSGYVLQGSYYTSRSIYLGSNTKLNIQGNWVTDEYLRSRMQGDLMVDYVSHFVTPSLGAVHPKWGKYDPRRYNVALDSKWSTWRVDYL